MSVLCYFTCKMYNITSWYIFIGSVNGMFLDSMHQQ